MFSDGVQFVWAPQLTEGKGVRDRVTGGVLTVMAVLQGLCPPHLVFPERSLGHTQRRALGGAVCPAGVS